MRWRIQYCSCPNRGPGPLLKKCSGLAQALNVITFASDKYNISLSLPAYFATLIPSSHWHTFYPTPQSHPSLYLLPSSLYSWIPSQVKAMYNYKGQGLGLTKGEVFYLLKKSNKDWWSVRWRSCDLVTMPTWAAIFSSLACLDWWTLGIRFVCTYIHTYIGTYWIISVSTSSVLSPKPSGSHSLVHPSYGATSLLSLSIPCLLEGAQVDRRATFPQTTWRRSSLPSWRELWPRQSRSLSQSRWGWMRWKGVVKVLSNTSIHLIYV